MKWVVPCSLLLIPTTLPAVASDRPPNIIVVFTDDQGYGDLGCYGSPNIETPHIDRLAAEGMRFTSFYAAPFCGPSRAALMTGCYPPRASLAFNHGPGAETGINPDEVTVAELLKGAGYATLHLGKWHLGDAPQFLPTRHGFDEYFGLPYSNDMYPHHEMLPILDNEPPAQQAIRARARYTGSAWKQGQATLPHRFQKPLPLIDGETAIETMPDQTQLTTRYTERAIRFIGEHRHEPFFIYLAHAMPHVYLHVSDRFQGKSERGLYGDVIMEIDWSVGQIRQTLEELGLDENTLIVYTSDNGPWLPYGIDGGSAGPLRGGKGSTFEGGMRVPGIFWWPGKIPAGTRTNEIAANMDLLPTFANLAGAEVPTDRVIDGRSLVPLLTGATDRGPHDVFYYFGGSRSQPEPNLQAVRDRRWKLTLRKSEDEAKLFEPEALYDLAWDVSERTDRIQDHPEAAARLEALAREFHNEFRQNIRPIGKLAAVE
ncbi:MAG: sulfatase [Planctomycetaceae bacterium]